MKNFAKYAGLFIAGVIVGLLFFAVSTGGGKLGGVYNQVAQYFYGGLYAGNSNQFSVSSLGAVSTSGDMTITGGTLSVPTSASATSTLVAGCVQTYATSSATVINLTYNTVATTTGNGFVLWSYGACPNL